jgi:hypothetical protein
MVSGSGEQKRAFRIFRKAFDRRVSFTIVSSNDCEAMTEKEDGHSNLSGTSIDLMRARLK